DPCFVSWLSTRRVPSRGHSHNRRWIAAVARIADVLLEQTSTTPFAFNWSQGLRWGQATTVIRVAGLQRMHFALMRVGTRQRSTMSSLLYKIQTESLTRK